MLDGPHLSEELLSELGNISGITTVRFSPECTTQAKPAVLVLSPDETISEETLQTIGIRVREILSECSINRNTPVKASIEYPVGVDEDGYSDVDEESLLLKLRWRQQTSGGISNTRLNGYSLEDGLPEPE